MKFNHAVRALTVAAVMGSAFSPVQAAEDVITVPEAPVLEAVTTPAAVVEMATTEAVAPDTMADSPAAETSAVAPSPEAPVAAAAVPVAPTAEPAPGAVAGFRSARFGMTEDEIIAAVHSDFGTPETAVRRGETLVDKTRELSVVVDDLLPGSGPARITYTLGFSSQSLSTVDVVWGGDDAAPVPEVLQAAAALLLDYFASQPYVDVTTDQPTDDGGRVAFTGHDSAGRRVTMTLGKALVQDGPTSPVQRFVRVRYELDPANPDVFRIKPGQF